MTLRRRHSAARRRGEFNRDRGSRLLSQAVDAQRRLNARRADDARTVAHPVGPSDPRDTYLTQSHDQQRLPMPQFESLECKTRLHATASQAEPIRDLVLSAAPVSEPIGDLGEAGYRAFETRGATSHSGAPVAGRLVAGRVGEIIARREFKHARIRLDIERFAAHSVSPQVQPLSTRAPGISDEAVRRRRAPPSRPAATVARPPGFRRGASSARTGPPDESSHFALGGRPRTDVTPFERRS